MQMAAFALPTAAACRFEPLSPAYWMLYFFCFVLSRGVVWFALSDLSKVYCASIWKAKLKIVFEVFFWWGEGGETCLVFTLKLLNIKHKFRGTEQLLR